MREQRAKIVLLGILLSIFVWLVAPHVPSLFLYSEGEGGELYDCHLSLGRVGADIFAEKLKNTLKAEGFVPTSSPEYGPFFIQSEGATYTAYSGEYRGSLPFTIGVMRDGPELNCFHVSYVWNYRTFSRVGKSMRQSTAAFSAFLRDWAESHGAIDYLSER